MRRIANAVVLIICLVAFLCPAVGKATVIALPKHHSCSEPVKQHSEDCGGCPREQSQSQPNHCCPVPCSMLILFCAAADGFSTPAVTEQLVLSGDAISSARTERPPVPPPRA